MTMGRKVEIELKYEVAVAGGGDRYLVAPDLGPFTPVGHVRSTRVEDCYVDSADWALSERASPRGCAGPRAERRSVSSARPPSRVGCSAAKNWKARPIPSPPQPTGRPHPRAP